MSAGPARPSATLSHDFQSFAAGVVRTLVRTGGELVKDLRQNCGGSQERRMTGIQLDGFYSQNRRSGLS